MEPARVLERNERLDVLLQVGLGAYKAMETLV